MFNLLLEVNDDVITSLTLVENIHTAFLPEEYELVFENVQKALQPAIAAAKAGNNPFGGQGNRPVVDPELLAGLATLADKDAREALNVDRNKLTQVVNNYERSEKVRQYIRQIGSRAKAKQDQLQQMAQEDPKKIGNYLQKLQMMFAQAATQQQQKNTPQLSR